MAELYSPPRVGPVSAQKIGLKAGEGHGYPHEVRDFTKDEHKQMAKEYSDKYRPRQMRRTTSSSATVGGRAPDLRLGTRRACAGRFAEAMKGAAQQGVPREENA